MDRRIKFRHLEAFVGIARAKSLKRAAEQLNLTQPAISKTLKDLETILDAPLMERNRAGVRLLPEGEVFLQFAEQSMQALQSGLNSIASIRGGDHATLTIGALPSVMAHLLPTALYNLRQVSPGTVVQVLEGAHNHLIDQLRTGALDLVVGRLGRPKLMDDITFTQLYSEDVVIVTAPNHPLVRATQLDQLRDYPIIYPPMHSAIRPLVARLMIASGMDLYPNRIESASAELGRAITLGSMQGIWFISRGVVMPDLDAGRLVALDIDTGATSGPIGMMARSEETPSHLVHLFRQSLTDAAKIERI